MRSLFAKILGWFVVALLVTVFATVATSIISYNPNARARAPFSLMIGVGMVDATHAWETGGRAALRGSLARFKDVTRASTVVLTDANGTDLLTGEIQSDLMQGAHAWSRLPFVRRSGMVFDRFSADGKYCFFLVITPGRLVISNIQPAHLLVIATVVLMCYALA